MRNRFVKRCQCKITEPTIEIVPMSYGFQVDVSVKCSECGKPYRELVGKGSMVSNIIGVDPGSERGDRSVTSTSEIIEKAKKEGIPGVKGSTQYLENPKPEQVTSSTPTIARREEVGESLSFGEKMKLAKARKREKRLAEEKAAEQTDEANLTMAGDERLY